MVRIAEQVRRRVGGGRYFAACASVRLREEVEAELKARLGADRVHRVQVQPADGPWNSVRHYQLERGLPVERTLYTLWGVHGEGELSASHPYAQLNFARDAWGGTGTHLLVWLDRVGETARFAGMAPDLWSVRALVEEFLTLEDFPPIPGVVPEDEGALRRLRAEAADKARPADVRAWSALGLAVRLDREGRLAEALQVLSTVPPALRDLPEHLALEASIGALLGRPKAALRAVRRVPATGQTARLRAITESRALQKLGDPDAALGAIASIDGADAADVIGTLFVGCGRPSRAQAAPGPATGIGAALFRGDLLDAATLALQAPPEPATIGAAVEILSRLGLTASVLDAIPAVSPDRTLLASTTTRARAWLAFEGRVQPASWDPFRQHVLDASTSPDTRGLAAQVLLDMLAEPLSHRLLAPHLLPLAKTVLRRCKDDPEPLGVAREVISRLHLALGDRKRAAHHAAHLLAWAQEWRGPSVLIRIHALLADLHDDPAHADSAVDLARPRLSLYDLSHALQARARLRARHDDLPGARSDLAEALREVAAEGLRPELIRLHLAAASLPAGDDRADHAREALFLARTCRFIREEARALLVSVDLAPRPWSPHVRVQLDRATRIVRELGPPWLDPTVDRLSAAAPPRSAPPG